MEKGKKTFKPHSFHAKYVVLAVLTLIVLFGAGVAAKYLRTDTSEAGQATAKGFYFTTNILGDSYMVNETGTTGNGDTYAFPNVQSGTFYLYGGGAHDITINVQNFSDELRITEEDIVYTASVDGLSSASLKKDNDSCKGGTLVGNEMTTNTLVLNIPSCSTQQYKDSDQVTVKLESTSPYAKTIELNFVLYTVDSELWYQVKDAVGSPYAELVMMAGTDLTGGVQPFLSWSDKLSIDNTNVLTYSYDKTSGSFVQRDNMTSRKDMQISQPLKSGESVSIYFFKSDTSENYSENKRVVPLVDEKYSIAIPKAETTTMTSATEGGE
jgi:hypothetical protein